MPDSNFWNQVRRERDGVTVDVGEILQRLYESEINAEISWQWDGGVDWRLGDDQNGWKAGGGAATIELAVLELAKMAAERYEESEFAKWWRAR
jgi:hypothetical protein